VQPLQPTKNIMFTLAMKRGIKPLLPHSKVVVSSLRPFVDRGTFQGGLRDGDGNNVMFNKYKKMDFCLIMMNNSDLKGLSLNILTYRFFIFGIFDSKIHKNS
jgi:hypothetical protein